MSLEDAMKAAIKHCIDNGILKPFLETHSSEVMNILFYPIIYLLYKTKQVAYNATIGENHGYLRDLRQDFD